PPTAASVTSEGPMLNFARATRANMSGNDPGADTAMDLPLRSSILSIPALTMMPCGTTTQWQPMIFMSPPRTPTAIAPWAPPSYLSSSPASRALSPIWSSLTSSSSSLRPSRSAKPRLAAISRKPASALGAMIPCFQGFSACAGAAPAAAASIAPAATSRARIDVFISWPHRSLSARQRAFIEIPVKDHALLPAARDCERSAPPLAMRTQDGSHHDSSGRTRPKANARGGAPVARHDHRRQRRHRIGASHPCGLRLRACARDRARLGTRRRHHAHAPHLSVDRGDHLPFYQLARMGRLRAIVWQIYFADLAGYRAHGRDPGLSVAGASPFGDLCARQGRHQDREGPRGPRGRHPG